ncbi:MAG: hypothetical protein IOC86_04555 [Aestuariivirga sp.]|nr:hypothetical protein [Aestuariivirga sp.]
MEDEDLGALSSVGDAEDAATPALTGNPQALAVLNSLREEQRKRWDEYAQSIRAARSAQMQQPGPSAMDRLTSALLAAGRPNRGGSNWESLRQGLENWNQSGEAARQAQMQQKQLAAQEEAELAKMAFEQGSSLENLAAKYALAPQKSGWNVSGGISTGGEPYATYRDASGRLVVKTRAGETAFDAPGAPAGGAPATGGGAPAGGGEGGLGPIRRGPDGKYYRTDAFGIEREVFGGDTRPATPEEARQFGVTEGSFEGGVFKPGAGAVPMAQLKSEIPKFENSILHMQDQIGLAESLKSRAGPLTTGLGGTIAGFIPGTSAFTFKEDLTKTLGGNIAFDRLQQMREESKTGGALGQVAVQELDALRSSMAALNASMDMKDLVRNLDMVIAKYKRAMSAYQRMVEERKRTLSGGAPAQGGAARKDPLGIR